VVSLGGFVGHEETSEDIGEGDFFVVALVGGFLGRDFGFGGGGWSCFCSSGFFVKVLLGFVERLVKFVDTGLELFELGGDGGVFLVEEPLEVLAFEVEFGFDS